MDRVYRQVAAFGKLTVRKDDDFVDRLNYMYTCAILIIFSIVISTKQYVGEPISCWTPAHFKGSHDKYANNICWVANTYWLPFDDVIPESHELRAGSELSYYQYVPFVLLIQAMCFHIPCLFWRALNSFSGMNVRSIVDAASDSHNLNPENRNKTIRYLGRHLEMGLENLREYRSGRLVRARHYLAKRCCLFCGRRYGNFLTFSYMTTKIVYLGHVLAEMYLLNKFLGTQYTFYGIEVLHDLVRGNDWKQSGIFPRVTMCDFKVRRLGAVHSYTIQCVLPINMFNEKMFIFLWFWFLLVMIATLLSTCRWFLWLTTPQSRTQYIRKFLKVIGIFDKTESKLVDRFTVNYLRQDGILMLRLVGLNAGEMLVTDLVQVLWLGYRNKPAIKDTAGPFAQVNGSIGPLIQPYEPGEKMLESMSKKDEEVTGFISSSKSSTKKSRGFMSFTFKRSNKKSWLEVPIIEKKMLVRRSDFNEPSVDYRTLHTFPLLQEKEPSEDAESQYAQQLLSPLPMMMELNLHQHHPGLEAPSADNFRENPCQPVSWLMTLQNSTQNTMR